MICSEKKIKGDEIKEKRKLNSCFQNFCKGTQSYKVVLQCFKAFSPARNDCLLKTLF